MEQYTKILKLSWPILLSYVSYHILGVTDILMVGSLGKEALAAVGIALTVFWFIVVPLEGFFESALILLSQAFGAKQQKEFKDILFHELLFAIVIGLLSLAIYPILSWILAWFSPSEALLPDARGYLFLSLLGLLPYFVSGVFTRMILAVGKNQSLALISNVTVVVNIILNYVLIFGKWGAPALGVEGSALATLIARLVQMVLIIGYSLNILKLMVPEKYKPKLNVKRIKEILKLGRPMFEGNLVEVGSWTLFVRVIAGLGVAPIASHELGMKIKDVAFLPGYALGTVTTSLVGTALGKKDWQEAREASFTVAKMAVVLMGGLGLVLFLFPAELLRLFTKDEEVIEIGVGILYIMAAYQIIDAIYIVFRSALNGVGDTKFVRNTMVLGGWLIMLPFSYAIVKFTDLGALGAWLGLTLNVLISGLLMWYRFTKVTRKQMKVQQSNG